MHVDVDSEIVHAHLLDHVDEVVVVAFFSQHVAVHQVDRFGGCLVRVLLDALERDGGPGVGEYYSA